MWLLALLNAHIWNELIPFELRVWLKEILNWSFEVADWITAIHQLNNYFGEVIDALVVGVEFYLFGPLISLISDWLLLVFGLKTQALTTNNDIDVVLLFGR